MIEVKSEILNVVRENKIIAILRKVPCEVFADTVKALYDGGIRMMEVTFDPAGVVPMDTTCKQIKYIADNYQDIAPGAGTVLTVEQVEKAHEAGAQYIISPNTNEVVIKKTVELGMVSMPGAFTPSEAVNANLWGADFVKLFPIGKMGTGYVKDISAPLSNIKFLAVGGINDANLKEYLDAGCSGVGVGSALVNNSLITAGKFDELKALAEKYVAAAK